LKNFSKTIIKEYSVIHSNAKVYCMMMRQSVKPATYYFV